MTEGTRLLAGRYAVGDLIGSGGMSDVHVGTDSRLGRRVAIKLLTPALATDPRFRVMFREEAQKAARMAHPTIVRVFDAGEDTVTAPNGVETQVPFIVTEYVEGRSLKDLISDGPLDPTEAVRITSGVLTALEYSHRALLVHRDIKPANIMVTKNGQVKVMDFGIARAVADNTTTVAHSSALLGTAQYLSPEQARGEAVDARTDLYSVGIVLFEMLTGRPPFRGDRAAAVAYQHISENAVAPSSLNPKVSPALDAVVLHALAKDKFERFQTASEFRADLETAGAGAVPPRKPPANDFNAALFGSNPSAPSASDAALRQLSSQNDERGARTQTRPPVAFIWVGITLVIAILVGVVFWLVTLPQSTIGDNLSVTVPSLVGEKWADHENDLGKLKLVKEPLTVASDTVPQGVVISTDPKAGTQVGVNQTVKVYVSAGKNPVAVPSVANMTEDAAKAAITATKLVYGTSSPEHSATIPAGTVIRSDPSAGEQKREGDVINLVVSDGLITVPSVVGQDIAAANIALGPLQLSINPVGDASCTGSKVTSQSITGDNLPQHSNISLTYCSGS